MTGEDLQPESGQGEKEVLKQEYQCDFSFFSYSKSDQKLVKVGHNISGGGASHPA